MIRASLPSRFFRAALPAGRTVILPLLVALLSCPLLSTGSGPGELRPGEMIESVSCRDSPQQSYALYLPAAYTPRKSWPIIYAFDPGAHGDGPIRLYKQVAEKYGYIIAGSNNSQNFASDAAGVQAMLEDTMQRFSIDPKRIYTTGFSGGARVATWVALHCQCKVAGVIASGATYPSTASPAPTDSFMYFVGLGDTDFNFPELVYLQDAKERFGSAYRVRMFPGGHQWSPADVFEEAVAWFQLRAMQAGAVPKDEAFIREQWQRELGEADQGARAHDARREFFAYKSLVEDFRGLANTSGVEPKLQALRNSSDLKKAIESEHKQAEAQEESIRGIVPAFARFSANPLLPHFEPDFRAAILSSMQQLKRYGRTAKDEEQRKINQRAFDGVFVLIVEEGLRRRETRKFNEALAFFELVSEAAPERPWPALLIAETQLSIGDKKKALKAVRQAARTGHVSAEALEKDRRLALLFSDPEFQKVLEELRKQPASRADR